MEFIYQKISKDFCKNLDNDTLSIIKNYSIFYTEKDYELIFRKLEKIFEKYYKDYSKFIFLNIYLHNLLNQLDDILMDYHNFQIEYTLDEVYNYNKQYLMKILKNETLVKYILELYYEDNITFGIEYSLTYYDLMFNSRHILINKLEKIFFFDRNDISKFMFYIQENLHNFYDIILCFPSYKKNFIKFFKLETGVI